MEKKRILVALTCLAAVVPGFETDAQEARARAEMLDLIQREKFDVVLPGAMRDNGVDMWIHVIRDGAPAALARSANCSILPVRCYLPHGENTYRIRFEQPLSIDPSLPRKQATSDLMRRLNSTYESWIRETPEQWAWYQPRWRTRPGTLEAIPLSARAGRPDLPGANDGDD